VWRPTANVTELCLQLTAGSKAANEDEHRALRSRSCERALLTMFRLSIVRHLDSCGLHINTLRLRIYINVTYIDDLFGRNVPDQLTETRELPGCVMATLAAVKVGVVTSLFRRAVNSDLPDVDGLAEFIRQRHDVVHSATATRQRRQL